MNRENKRSVFTRDIAMLVPWLVGVIGGAVGYFLGGFVAATISFYVLLIAVSVILAIKQNPNITVEDERTIQLTRFASLIVARAFLALIMAAVLGYLFVAAVQGGETITINVRYLSFAVLGVMILFGLVGMIIQFIMRYQGGGHGQK